MDSKLWQCRIDSGSMWHETETVQNANNVGRKTLTHFMCSRTGLLESCDIAVMCVRVLGGRERHTGQREWIGNTQSAGAWAKKISKTWFSNSNRETSRRKITRRYWIPALQDWNCGTRIYIHSEIKVPNLSLGLYQQRHLETWLYYNIKI